MDDTALILAIIPLALIQISLQIYALYDILKKKRAKDPVWLWVVAVVFFQLTGVILYFILGRRDDVE